MSCPPAFSLKFQLPCCEEAQITQSPMWREQSSRGNLSRANKSTPQFRPEYSLRSLGVLLEKKYGWSLITYIISILCLYCIH